MKYPILLLLLISWSAKAGAQTDKIDIGGYLQALPVWISADLPDPFEKDSFWEYRLQNRLNMSINLSSETTLNWQMRTRLFAGGLVDELNDIPGLSYTDLFDRDNGYMNLSWIIADRENFFVHNIPDRLNVDWYSDNWRITAGRQRINWGVNMITNPNDLFNIYSFYEFDYPERPGTDALRIQYFMGWASRVDVAFSPAREMRNSVGAALYAFNRGGYDWQIIGGYYRNRLGVGGGWAGSIRQTGFKGELMLFSDLTENPAGNRKTNFVIAISGDHMLDNGLFLVAEGLYNSDGGQDQFRLFGDAISADSPSFSRFQFTSQGSYSFSPVTSGALSVIWYPDEEALFLSPSVTRSVSQNTYLNVFAQIFTGTGDSVFAGAGNVIGLSLKWNF